MIYEQFEEKFLEKVEEFENYYDLAEILYFESLKRFVEAQKDASKIDYTNHIEKVLEIFLSGWGLMGRVVNRAEFPSKGLTNTLIASEKELKPLRDQMFLTINFQDKVVSNSIRTIYDNLSKLKHVGPTTRSKILHLINPEIFVMWDIDIVKEYHKTNRDINNSSNGYVEFLKMGQKAIIKTLGKVEKESGKSMAIIEQELRGKYFYKYDNTMTKTIAKLIDEYNWITVPRTKSS